MVSIVGDLKQRHFLAIICTSTVSEAFFFYCALMLPGVLLSVFTLTETTFLSEGH